jgi:hypothetical protein
VPPDVATSLRRPRVKGVTSTRLFASHSPRFPHGVRIATGARCRSVDKETSREPMSYAAMKRGWANFLEVYKPLADDWVIYDSSKSPAEMLKRCP